VEFEVIPTLVVVRRELSKASHQYLTFQGEEGCGYFKDYQETRMRERRRSLRNQPSSLRSKG